MQKSRTKITFEFEVDLDMIPGFGHEPSSWVDYVRMQLERNSHYNPTLKVVDVDGKPQS